MKLHELLNEDEYDDAASGEESQHAAGNLDYALSDMILQELMKMAQDPVEYYRAHGVDHQDNMTAFRKIYTTLKRIDDKTLDLMSKSPALQRAAEENYDAEQDEAFIPLDAMAEVLAKVEKRNGPAEPPADFKPTIDFDHDDWQRHNA